MPETTQTVTVSTGADGTGWSTISGHKPEDVSITTQPPSGTASIELVDGQPEQTCIKVVNATPNTSQSVGVTIREHDVETIQPAGAQPGEAATVTTSTPGAETPSVRTGEPGAPLLKPQDEQAPVEADAAKPGPEPTASESSGTGDQAGGAVEHDEVGAEVDSGDPADTATESALPVGDGEGQVHPETGQRIPAGGLSDPAVAGEPEPNTIVCPTCGATISLAEHETNEPVEQEPPAA